MSRDLAAIAKRATEQAPEDRYRAVSDLRADLSRVIDGRPLLAESGNLRSTLSHFLSRNLVTSLLALAASTLIISLIVFFTIRLAAERDIAVQNEKRASNVLSFLVKTLTQADPFSVSSSPAPADAEPLTVAAAMDRAVSALVDDAAMAKGTDREKMLYFQCTREQVGPYKARMRTFAKEQEVFPGVIAMPANGHTPGHTIYQVQSGNEQLLIWGDTVHVPEIQAPHPEVCIDFDTDKEKAAASRRRVFDMVETDRLLIAGMHLHFPAFSHLVKQGSGYRIVPETWKFQM